MKSSMMFASGMIVLLAILFYTDSPLIVGSAKDPSACTVVFTNNLLVIPDEATAHSIPQVDRLTPEELSF